VSDLDLARLSRDAYRPVRPGVTRIGFEDISADIVGNVCAARGTSSFATMERDMEIEPLWHDGLGCCQAGALRAALGLLPLIPDAVDTFTGHSEAGGIAPILAALRVLAGIRTRLVVAWDGVKPGGNGVAIPLRGVTVREYRFAGSPVSCWPFMWGAHVMEPPIEIGDWCINPIEAHSIDRACAWLEARASVTA
jgi:hypothetical protein